MDSKNKNEKNLLDMDINLDNIEDLNDSELDDIMNEVNTGGDIVQKKEYKIQEKQEIIESRTYTMDMSTQDPSQIQSFVTQNEDLYKKDPLEAINIFEMQLSQLDKKTQEYYQIEYPQIFGQQQQGQLPHNQIKTLNFSTIDYIKRSKEDKDQMRRKIATLYVGKDGEIYLGTNNGQVLKYKKQENQPLVLFANGQSSAVTSIDIRDPFIVIGYHDGGLNIFNLKKAQLTLQIQGLHCGEILFAKFYNDINSPDPFCEKEVDKLTDISFLSCDKGELLKTTFTKGLFSGYKSNSDNFPDLYEYVEIVKRTQKASEEIRIKAGGNTIFQQIIHYSHEIVQVENITVFLQAFVTKDSVIILSESRQTKPMIVFYEKRSSERFRDVDPDSIPVIDFNKDVIAIGWGTIVYVVKLQLCFTRLGNNEVVVENKFPLKQRFYINQTNILYSNFIRKNIIFLIDYTNTCHIINLMKFSKDQYKYEENPEQSLNAHVFQSHNTGRITKQKKIPVDKVEMKSYFNSIQVRKEKIYLLSIINSNASNQYAEDYEILEGEILQWEFQLDLKFDKKKDLKSLIQTLEICLQIYQGNNQSFGEISTFKKDLQNYIARKVKECFEKYLVDLINYNIKKIDSRTKLISDILESNVQPVLLLVDKDIFDIVKINNVLMQFMKYLVLTNNTKYMFIDFFNSFKHIQPLKQIFYHSLAPYIILQQIKFFPSEEVYSTFFNYYDLLQQHDIISKFIFSMDLQQQGDYSYIKRSCNRTEFLSAFIYISTRFENNFKVPLQQMISDLESFGYQDSKKLSNSSSSSVQKEWIGHKLLWFIKRTLSGLIYPNQQMEEGQWSEASNCIFEWIFIDRNLVKLLKIDPDLALQNILMFFRGYSSDLLKNKEQEYKTKFQKMIQNLNVKAKSNTEEKKETLKTLICKYLHSVLEQNDSDKYLPADTWNYFYLLLAEVKDKDVLIDSKLSTQAAYYLIENPNSHFYRNKDLALEIEYRSRQIIKLIQPHTKKKQIDLAEVLKRAINSPFVEVCSYIYRLQEDFDQAIKIYLDASFIDISFKVFSFIKELLDTQQDKQAIVIEKIFNHLPKLIQINHTQTKELLERIQVYDIHAIVKALNGQEELTYKILSEYIQEQKKKILEESLPIPETDTYLYLLYIKLLIKFKPEEVVNELKTQLYQLEPVEKILKEQDHLPGIAYVYTCYGNIKGALQIHLNLTQRYIERKDKFHAIREFHETQELLLKTNKRGDEDCENNWFYWITSIQKMEQKTPSEMIDLQKKFEEECFETVVHNVQIKSILQNKDLLPLLGSNTSEVVSIKSKLFETLQTLLKSYTFEQKIFEYSKDTLYSEYKRKEFIAFKLCKKGIKFNNCCSECSTELTDNYTHFYCSHTYCPKHTKSYCQICFEKMKNSFKGFDAEAWKSIYGKYLQQQKQDEEKEALKKEKEKQVQQSQEVLSKQEEERKNQEKKRIHMRKLQKLKNFDKNNSESRQDQYNFHS